MGARTRRGISDAIVIVVLAAVGIAAGSFIWLQMNAVQSGYGGAKLAVDVRPVYPASGLILDIEIKNVGGKGVVIRDVIVDNTSIVGTLGWNGTALDPGASLSKVIDATGLGLQPGKHAIIIVYEENGVIKQEAFGFTV